MKHLADLEPGPLKLYLYFGFHSNNQNGSSWHSIETIAQFFNTQTRTINNWIKVLVDRKLIYRERSGHKSNTTYLIQYSTNLIKLEPTKGPYNAEDQSLIEDLTTTAQKYSNIYGRITGVYHLFQWGTQNKKANIESNLQIIIILTQRDDEVVTAFYNVIQVPNNLIDYVHLEDPVRFDSHLKYEDKPIRGIALKHYPKIFDEAPREVIEDLAQMKAVDYERLPIVKYGPDIKPNQETSEE